MGHELQPAGHAAALRGCHHAGGGRRGRCPSSVRSSGSSGACSSRSCPDSWGPAASPNHRAGIPRPIPASWIRLLSLDALWAPTSGGQGSPDSTSAPRGPAHMPHASAPAWRALARPSGRARRRARPLLASEWRNRSPATSSTRGAVSSSRLRSAEGPRRQDPQRLHTNVQIFATTRRQSVSLIVPRPWCAGPTSDYVGVMPARSRKSLAKLADHAASKESKQGSEASPASAGDLYRAQQITWTGRL